MLLNLHGFYETEGRKIVADYSRKPVDIDTLARQITLNQVFSRDALPVPSEPIYLIVIREREGYKVANVAVHQDGVPDEEGFHDFIVAGKNKITVEDELERACIWIPRHLRNLPQKPITETRFYVRELDLRNGKLVSEQSYADARVIVSHGLVEDVHAHPLDYWSKIASRSLLQKPTSADSLIDLKQFEKDLSDHPGSQTDEGRKALTHVRNLFRMIQAHNYEPRQSDPEDNIIYRFLLESGDTDKELQLVGVKV